MIGALGVLLACDWLGEAIRRATGLPVPGPVLGMLLLAAALVAGDRLRPANGRQHAASSDLDRTADALISHMGLLFIPAGVGVVTLAPLLKDAWLPILGGVLGSTLLSLIITALVIHLTIGSERRTSHEAPALDGGLA